MKKKLYRSLAIAAAAVLTLTGCGSSVKSAATESAYEDSGYYTGYEEPAEYMLEEEAAGAYDMKADYSSSAASGTAENLSNTSASDQKMIITWNISMQTEHYSEILEKLHTDILSSGGYIESESESMWGDDNHNCTLVIRIPADKLDSWVSGVNEYGTITYRSQSQENATLTYIDMESRITALRTEQEALLGLMSRAESMEDIIAIQSQLTNVNYEIESYESQLRSLSNSVKYATIYLDINEVSHEVPTTMTIWQEISVRFTHSITALGRFFRNLLVGILGNSVIIILFAGIIAGIVFFCKKAAAKSRKKRLAAMMAAQNKETVNEANPQ